ncbi:hypothetical protein PDESU_05631 [Pontiella desulfatans]|uniref:Bacterial repeat domain-containing protein n=1 Tax=Pontiella desulfatans TaxID=2750659 RepID=A0A6C2UBN8_PONDE|nr:hypothetical protein [Pontiella desulfatans]VGO17037.1 hypothetical protein PDESU_05631 [Pontiella desulfatans]
MKKTISIFVALGVALSVSAMHNTYTVSGPVDTRDYILTVTSPYGTVSNPESGVSTNSWHSMVYSSVSGSPEYEPSGTTLHSLAGFSGEGTDPASGSGTAWVKLTNVTSTLTWDWSTLHWITWAVSGLGEIQPVNMAYSGNGAWCAENDSHHLRAVPQYGWLLTGWSGGYTTGPGATDIYFVPTAPTNILASFSDDPDGDGLKNVDEWESGADPWLVDTDSDGFNDAFEFAQGLSPTRDSSAFLTHIQDNPETYGLYPSNAVLDVALGEMLMDVAGTEATLSLQLETSDDLQSWSNAGPAQVWSWTVDGDKQFFRVKSSK